MSVVLLGSTSGSITLQEPAVAGSNTVNFGANTGVAILDANTPAFRNRIINGNMAIDQRNNGAVVTFAGSASSYALDRFLVENATDGVLTVQQSSTAPTGFSKSTLITITTADASLAATQRCRILQPIEGFNTADLAFGTASASPVTLSFWVRSSLTGTFGGALNNGDVNRSYPFTYTISAANTFEYKTVTVSGETTGTWNTGNTVGMYVQFGLGVGSTFSGTAGSWASSQIMSVTGAVSVVGTSGATFYITGVQLEKGSTATAFDNRDYGTELMLCQRYLPTITSYLTNNNTYSGTGFYKNNTTTVQLAFSFVVQARIPPTGLTVGSGASFTVISNAAVNAFAVTSPTFNTAGFTWAFIDGTVASGVANTPVFWLINGGASASNAYFTGCEL